MRILRLRAVIEFDVPCEDDEQAEGIKASIDVDNECIECGYVGLMFQRIMGWCDEHSGCWGCWFQQGLEVVGDTVGDPPEWYSWRESVEGESNERTK